MSVPHLINWFTKKHPDFLGDNTPVENESFTALEDLDTQILSQIRKEFGEVIITYAFTSFELLKYIKKNSPGDMAPELDQHAAFELNSRNNRICKRDGAACDIFVIGFEKKMHLIAEYIIKELPFDRLYFYGSDCPIHVTFGPDQKRYLHTKQRDENGKRNVGRGATGEKALALLSTQI